MSYAVLYRIISDRFSYRCKSITISDDELFDSALKFERTSEFKQAEVEAKKVRGESISYSSNFISSSSHSTRVSIQDQRYPCIL